MLSDYLNPVDIDGLFPTFNFSNNQWGNLLYIHTKEGFPDLERIKIALIGVGESEGSAENAGCKHAPDHVRKSLYRLHQNSANVAIADLGNILPGNTYQDTIYAMKTVVGQLLIRNIIPIIVGGSHDLTYGQFLGYEEINETVNIASVDEKINITQEPLMPDSEGFLLDLFLHEPNILFNYCQLGHQSYFVDNETLAALEKLHFDCYRLGHLTNNMEEVEAIIRDSDITSFDISAVQSAFAPGHALATPNGFNGEQACQIARYAGISDKMSSFGIYELNPLHDNQGTTGMLAAQMIWYFVEGYLSRMGAQPTLDRSSFTKYTVDLEEEHDITFWKSQRSGRWWMEVPYSPEKQKFKKHHLVSCAYSDYQECMKGSVPDRWINAYDKLS